MGFTVQGISGSQLSLEFRVPVLEQEGLLFVCCCRVQQ